MKNDVKYTYSVWLGWGPVPGMMGPMALGGQALNRSMHELGKAYLRSFFIFTKIVNLGGKRE